MTRFYKHKVCILLAVMTLSTSKIENVPQLDVTCDISGIYLLFTFEKPFKGVIYSLNHFYDEQCSVSASTSSGNMQLLLYLPINSCGNLVTGNGTRSISNTVVVQQHSVLQTVHDFTQDVMCDVFHPTKRIFVPKSSENDSQELKFNELEIWADFKLDLDGISTDKVNLGTRILLVIHVKDGGIHKGISVQNCLAHDREPIHNASKIASLNNEYGCPYPLAIISEFNFTKQTHNVSDIMAYAEIKAFKFPTQGNIFLTCRVKLCKYDCSNTCSERELSATTPRNLVKRSMEGNFPLIRSLENRNRLMKSTIKALTEALVISKRGRILNSNQLEKRIFDDSFENNYYHINTETSIDENSISTTLSERIDSHEQISTRTTESDINVDINEISNEFPSEIPSVESSTLASEQNSANMQTNFNIEENFNDIVYFNVTKSFSVTYPVAVPEDNFPDYVSKENTDSDCVPRIRFSLVTGMLSAILFCLLLTCFAMVLHIRREKKRHLIDNFLLYNFY